MGQDKEIGDDKNEAQQIPCRYICYLSLVHLVSVEAHIVFLGIWLMVFVVHG
jgi:hypothetical protein